MIEKNIFQTWKTNSIPFWFRPFQKTFILQKGFNYKLYSDQEIQQFVQKKFPEYLSVFNTLSIIEKTDVFRLLVIYTFGGMYTDLDTHCNKNLSQLFSDYGNDYDLILGIEINKPDYIQYSNWTIIAKKQAPVLKLIIDELIKHIEQNFDKTPVYKTGPAALTQQVQKFNFIDHKIKILPISYFGAGQGHSNSPKSKDGFIVHHFLGSWKGKNKLKIFKKQVRFYLKGLRYLIRLKRKGLI